MAEDVRSKECYSCGGEADPNSPRNFCEDCDAHFAAGEKNQERVYARAYLLEEAKFNEDAPKVEKIMGEIFKESVVPPKIVVAHPTSSATAREGKE